MWVTISSGLTRELIWWGVVILAVAVAAQLVRKPFAGFGVGNFTYPMRSSRVVPALTQGLHSGLSAFVGFVLLTPVIVLQTQLLATSPVWAGLSVSGLSGVVAVCEALTLAVTQAPLASAVLLFAVPLAVVILLHRLTEPALAVDVSEWLLPEDAPPALYLRTWESDAIPMRLRPVGSRFIDAVLPAKKSNFTESLGRNLSLIAPVALIGEPGTARQQGVGSMWSSDERWRELVESYAERALCTVFAASEVPPASGFSWEIELIGSGDTTGRVVIVFPPHFDFVRAFAPGGYLAEASRKPIFHGIEQAQPTERTVVMVRAKDGTWDCMDASVRDDSVYANCMFDLRLDNADGWENGVLGETDFPSTINAQRFVSTIASGLGWNPTLAATTVGWLYPALRQILILVRRAHQGKPLSGS